MIDKDYTKNASYCYNQVIWRLRRGNEKIC